MAKDKTSNVSSNLPDELLEEIHSKLPMKTICRNFCISKSASALLNNERFIRSHLKNWTCTSSKNTPKLCITMTVAQRQRKKMKFLLHVDDEEFRALPKQLEFPFDAHYCLIASTNGLLCLVNHSIYSRDSSFVIWNPILGKIIRVPKPHLFRTRTTPVNVCVGFGYSSETHDYKILRIITQEGPDNLSEDIWTVERYSLMENSWVQKENPPRYDLYSNEPMLFLNGIAHVIVLERSESDYNWTVKLLGVDLNSEEFLTITLPGSLATYHHHKHELHLIETNSRLGVVDSEPTAAGHRIGIWLMTETDGVAYWSNIFSLTVPKMQVFRAVGIRDNGDLLAYGRNAKVKGLLSYGNQGTKDLLLGLGCRRFCNSLRFVDGMQLLSQKEDVLDWSHDDEVKEAFCTCCQC